MCSWCWGFAPVVSAIRETYGDRLTVSLIMGGLRPGTTEVVTPQFREEILHHWHQVHERTGQSFDFEGAMPEGFVYDTEPPSRAVIAVSELAPDVTFPYFKSVQSAFYTQRWDVTRAEALAVLAERQGIALEPFLERFNSEDARRKTRQHFYQSREAGVTGFPTVILQRSEDYSLLTVGYRPFDDLRPQLDAWLAA
jgi:putative protein-disulfide isomerase